MSDRTDFVEHAMNMETVAQDFVKGLMATVKTEDQKETVFAIKAVIDAQSEVIRTLVEYNLQIIDAVEAEIEKQEEKSRRSTWKNTKE